jgi:HlyD family secretion protein
MPGEMSRAKRLALLGLLLGCAAAAFYFLRPPAPDADVERAVGIVRETEIQIAPEINGRLGSLHVATGQKVRMGEPIATLVAPELAAQVAQLKASEQQALANRDHVFAGVRQEQMAIAAENVRIADSDVKLARQQFARVSTLASKQFNTEQQLDVATTARDNAEAKLRQLKATEQESRTGPTAEERAVAEAEVALATAKWRDLEAKFAKTQILAPIDGVVGLIVASEGETISPGQPVATLYAPKARWFSFTVREDRLGGVKIGGVVEVVANSGRRIPARVTEIRPLGEFATWRAARAVGDHDLNSFLIRADPVEAADDLAAGMIVWLEPTRGESDAKKQN